MHHKLFLLANIRDDGGNVFRRSETTNERLVHLKAIFSLARSHLHRSRGAALAGARLGDTKARRTQIVHSHAPVAAALVCATRIISFFVVLPKLAIQKN